MKIKFSHKKKEFKFSNKMYYVKMFLFLLLLGAQGRNLESSVLQILVGGEL